MQQALRAVAPAMPSLAMPSKVDHRLAVKSCIDDMIGSRADDLSRLFFRRLFQLNIGLKSLFPGNVVILNRKFSSMLGTFRNVKHLEQIRKTVEKLGERHILKYGAQIEHLDTAGDALLLALEDFFKDGFTPELKAAWRSVYDDVAALMKEIMDKVDRREIRRPPAGADQDALTIDEIGGEDVVTRVHKRFYTAIYDHPWLKQFFYGKPMELLVTKQTQFMVANFNGPNNYTGDTPAFVHMHMFITDEIADLREEILRQAILDEGLSPSIADRWLKVDSSFREGIVKTSVDECVLKCRGQFPIVAKKPT